MLPVIKRRLHRQIYFTIVVCLIAVVVASGLFFAAVRGNEPRDPFDILARLTSLLVLPPGSPQEKQQERIKQLSVTVRLGVALYKPDGTLIAAHGRNFPPPDFEDYKEDRDRRGEDDIWEFDDDARAWFLKLPDGRWFAADATRFKRRPPLGGLLLYFGLMIATIGLAAWPFVRRLTGRLNRLEDGVRRIGEGELSTRVEVEGKDEIATLAESFNTSAERIERLVNSNRQLLAHASHELRTPLARVRLGVEMLKEREDPKRRAALERDIAELDSLIDEILTMSRLDTGTKPAMNEEIDLLALAAEECARYEDCSLYGAPAEINGNSKLLSRLLRNLLDNAHRHGKAPVTVSVETGGPLAILSVSDSGDGIPDDQRAKVFEPFYRCAGKQNVEGYGLGLALVSQIAKAHGGHATIGDGRESRIIVSLPVNSDRI
ncbi:MAG: sensor histidine kinase [Rhizobiaceae bacterium]